MLKKFFIHIGIISFYLIIAVFFLKGILFSPGIISGGDWGFPLTQSQIQRYLTSGFYTWTDREIFGSENFFLNSLPMQILIGGFGKLGITGDIYSKLLLIFAFIFPAYTMFLLCRFFKCEIRISFFGGLLYMTLPIFFNYAVMGWLFVLLSMGILPLAVISFIKSVKENKLKYSIIAGLLYSLAMIQSQSLVWYPLVFLCLMPYLISGKKSLFIYLKSLSAFFLVFLALNTYWYLPLFINGKNSGVLNTNLALSTTSLGTWVRLNILNILRVWGSLFNEPYESSAQNNLIYLSLALPFVAYSTLLFLKKNRLVTSLALLSLFPVILFLLGPNFISHLPFSDLIRDTSRFLVLSSFAYVILATLALNFLLENKQRISKLAAIVFIILLLLSTYSFWSGELSGRSRLDHDIRLRTYNFPIENTEIESILNMDSKDVKVLYLPVASELSITDDRKFYGAFKGIRDITSSYSSKPGQLGLSDRITGTFSHLINSLEDTSNPEWTRVLHNLLKTTNIKYIVVRRNMTHPSYAPGSEIIQILKQQKYLELIGEWKNLSFFEYKNYLPHFYILSGNNKIPIKSNKINATKYKILIENVKDTVSLIFSEKYHNNWKIYQDLDQSNYFSNGPLYQTWSNKPLFEKKHALAYGYANSWSIAPESLCNNGRSTLCYKNPDGSYNIRFIVEFWPQRFFYIGALFSAISIISIFIYLVTAWKK